MGWCKGRVNGSPGQSRLPYTGHRMVAYEQRGIAESERRDPNAGDWNVRRHRFTAGAATSACRPPGFDFFLWHGYRTGRISDKFHFCFF
uniref:Uncharacterized protein n=1 Tax=Setaria viridis TaxID=4556 RepID=A0A4U6WFT0_SETVI|nr:hypothetical protein SEVIR_1G334300v2 [Setaria viridis]